MPRRGSSSTKRSTSELQLPLISPVRIHTNSDLVDQVRRGMKGASLQTTSHDQGHIERVFNLCMHIGKKEGADLEILGLAALFHDMGRAHEADSKGKVCHAEKGAVLARALLERYGVDETKIGEVVECIRGHRFRGGKRPATKEGRVLFDADKLDAIGAIGIGRAFLFAEEIGANLHNDGQTDVSRKKPYTKDDTAYRELVVKLRRIKARMFTEEGRRLTKGRHRFMTSFFRRFQKEIQGSL